MERAEFEVVMHGMARVKRTPQKTLRRAVREEVTPFTVGKRGT